MSRSYAQLCPNSMGFLYAKKEGTIKCSTNSARLIIWNDGVTMKQQWFPNRVIRNFKLVPGGANQCTFKVLKSFIGEN